MACERCGTSLRGTYVHTREHGRLCNDCYQAMIHAQCIPVADVQAVIDDCLSEGAYHTAQFTENGKVALVYRVIAHRLEQLLPDTSAEEGE
jgi:hypothetical protein